MKVKLLVGALVVLVVMNLATIGAFLFVQLHHPRPAAVLPEGAGVERLHARLLDDLSRPERRRLFRAMRSFHEETRSLVEDTRALEDDLVASMNQSPAPRAHIDSLLQQISDNRLEIARRATDRMIAMGDSLTPEEREHMIDALMRMRQAGPPGQRARGWRARLGH
jgi:uncharacterized membrane protein